MGNQRHAGAAPSEAGNIRDMSGEEVECPFCGEPGEIAGDYDPDAVGDQVFVQDCAVCCRPATVTVRVDAEGAASVTVEP